MAQLTVISRERHAGKRWKRYSSYVFAAGDALAPLVAQEMARACLTLPTAFVQAGDSYQLVAVLGLRQGENLFVTPDGRWLGGYVPAAYRGYPFVLADAQDGRRVLCLRSESELVSGAEGEPFFDDNGEPAKLLGDVLNFLEQVGKNGRFTAGLCALLAKHGVIQPWEIKLQVDGDQRAVQGLFKVDEARLNALPADAFEALRQGGALSLVYCQLVSMQHLQRLGQLARSRSQAQAAPVAPEGELDLEFLQDGESIRFS